VIDADAPASASVGQTAPFAPAAGLVNVAQGRAVPADITGYLVTRTCGARP